MTAFLIGAALAVAAALLILLRPFWLRRSARAVTTRQQLNAAIYRDQFAELERDRREGELGEEDYIQARDELQRRVLEDSQQEEAPPAPPAPKKTIAALAVLVPLAAFFLYFLLGNPNGVNPPPPERRFSAEEIDRMVAGLAAKLEKEPDNLKGWVMLARSYKALGRVPEAEKAYGRAFKLVETDANLLADYAEVLALNAGGSLEGKPAKLIEQALKLDPDSGQALVLAGTLAYERADFAKAADYWERLLKQLPPESEDAKSVAESITKARAQASSKPRAGAAKK